MTTYPSELKISETEEQRGNVDQNEEMIDAPYAGRLQVSVVSSIGMFPVEGASVRLLPQEIRKTGSVSLKQMNPGRRRF